MSGGVDAPTRRAWLPGVMLAVVVVLGWCVALTTPYLANALGLGPTGAFLDLRGITAANEAAGQGLDPYALNPLDPYQRPFLYSTWWLWPAHHGGTRADTGWLGVTLAAMTLAAVLIVWKPRSAREALIGGLILLSPAWLLAVYRANNDLVIFVLLAGAVWALQRSPIVGRGLAAVLVGVVTILKYYPVAAVIGVLQARRRREGLLLFALVAGTIAVGWASLAPAITAISRYGFIATGSVGLQAFGLKVLLQSFAPFVPALGAWLAAVVALAGGYRLAGSAATSTTRSAESDNRLMVAAIFGIVLASGFFIGTSFYYKLVFVWGLLPWLVRDARENLGARRALTLTALVIGACWADGIVATFINALGPGWSQDQRKAALTFSHGFAMVSQLADGVLIGGCLRLALDWSRRQVSRLALAP